MSRKTKLDRALIARAADLLERGHYVETVCAYLGIHPATWYRWAKDGETARGGLSREFCEAIARASAKVEVEAVDAWRRSFTDWRAVAAFLERRYPAKWGRAPREPEETAGAADHTPAACAACEERAADLDDVMGLIHAVVPQLSREEQLKFIRAAHRQAAPDDQRFAELSPASDGGTKRVLDADETADNRPDDADLQRE